MAIWRRGPRYVQDDPDAVTPPRRARPVAWIARLLFKAGLIFVLVSVLWVGLYRFVPPPFTWTMLGDAASGNGVARAAAMSARRSRPGSRC